MMSEIPLLLTGRDHYDDLYAHNLSDEARWLEFGAKSKCDSVEMLLKKAQIDPQSIIEIGCGTGAILRELKRRGIGSGFVGIDYSAAAIEYARAYSPGIQFSAADICDEKFAPPTTHFDLIVVSHVLEHLEDPRRLLNTIRRLSFSALIAEVPLEDLPIARAKSLVRDRRLNLAGHVQFFTAKSFRSLLQSMNFQIVAERRYANVLSREAVELAIRRNGFGRCRGIVYTLASHYLPGCIPLWSRMYYAHFAVLCRNSIEATGALASTGKNAAL